MNNINSCDKYSPLPVDQKYSLLPDDDIVSCIWEEAGCLYWWVPLLGEEGGAAEPETRTTPAMDQSHSQDPGHVDHHPDLEIRDRYYIIVSTNQRRVLHCINQSEKSITWRKQLNSSKLNKSLAQFLGHVIELGVAGVSQTCQPIRD